MTQERFNKIYRRSLPSRLHIFFNPNLTPDEREAIATALAPEFAIDNATMVLAYDPFNTFDYRTNVGMKSVPAYKSDKQIKVSLAEADYPAHADFIAKDCPFQRPWYSRAAGPPEPPDGVGSEWHPLHSDEMPLDSLYMEPGSDVVVRMWEKNRVVIGAAIVPRWIRIA